MLLHPSVTGRFAAHAPGMPGLARRMLRTSLRFTARQVVPHLDPADAPLPRERAKAPYTAREIAGYLALAGAQPAPARRAPAAALVCPGAGAGLIRSDLRTARGTDVHARSGGVAVEVRGARPRAVPVLACYHERLLETAAFAGGNFLTGGTGPERGNITNPLTRTLAGARRPAGPARQPAAGHLARRRRGADRPARVHARRRDLLLPAPRRHHRRPGPGHRSRRGDAARRQHPVTRRRVSAIGLPLLEDITDASGAAPLIETLLPAGVRHRQLHARTLLIGMQLALSGRRPAHLTEVHAALTSLPAADQQRLGVTADWHGRPHQLTCRQVEHTHRLITRALTRTQPDGTRRRPSSTCATH